MDFTHIIECPHCKDTYEVDFQQYINNQSSYERQMGAETEYTVECEEFDCIKCGKSFMIEGSFYEYPVGAKNYDNITVIKK